MSLGKCECQFAVREAFESNTYGLINVYRTNGERSVASLTSRYLPVGTMQAGTRNTMWPNVMLKGRRGDFILTWPILMPALTTVDDSHTSIAMSVWTKRLLCYHYYPVWLEAWNIVSQYLSGVSRWYAAQYRTGCMCTRSNVFPSDDQDGSSRYSYLQCAPDFHLALLVFCHVASLPYTQMLLKHIKYVVII